MELTVIDNISAIDDLVGYMADKDYVAYDCETTGLLRTDQVIGYSVCAEETKAFYVILAKWSHVAGAMVYIPGAVEHSLPLIRSLQHKSLIMHNSVFDCIMAEAFFKIELMPSVHTDTMILAHLLNENRRVGLKELCSQMFGEDAKEEQEAMKASVTAAGGKLTKSLWEGFKADPYLMGRYGAKDALLTYKLFITLVPELFEQGLDKFFYEEESMPLLRGPTYDLNNTGLQVDTNRLQLLKKQLEAECHEAKAFIYSEIDAHVKVKYPGTSPKTTFNISAPVQMSWLLFGQMGLDFGTLTKEGKNVCKALGLKLPYSPVARRDFIATCLRSVGTVYKAASIFNGKKRVGKKVREPWAYIMSDKRTLAKLAPKYKWISTLLSYQSKTKLLTTYVEGIQQKLQYGIIRPSFLQHGTTSGRYASRTPNFQNLPRDDKRIKECIVPRPGMAFVGADYSQLEPRVFAYVSQDPTLIDVFKGSEDFYSRIGMEVYGKYDCTPYKEGTPDAFGTKYKKLRDLSKVIALASTYGATEYQLAPTTGKSAAETRLDIEAYFERFPKVAAMMLESHEMAKRDGQVTNIFGRPRRIPEAKRIVKLYGNQSHADLPYEARKLLNLAVNHRIQSTGASIVNRAAIRFHTLCKDSGISARLLLQVHDSLIAECAVADAENVSLLLQEAMENTVILQDVKLEAVPKIGYSLGEV